MFKKILVPVDGSELAEQALEPALTLAAREQGEVLLVRVPLYNSIMLAAHAEYGVITPIEPSLEQSRQDAFNYLQALAERLERPYVTITPLLVEGDVAGTIVDTAVAHQVDLIVMSTHGYSGVTRWLIGSITEKVLRCAPCPILVIRSSAPINKILITLDGSELSEQALDPGLAIAHKLDAQICLLNVAADMLISPMELAALEQAGSGLGQQIQESALANAQDYLAAVIARKPELGEMGKTAVSQGPAAKTILDFADAEEVDLIVMATHGRTGLRRWVYGSVTERVLHGAHCAMLIIRPPDDVLQ